MGESTTVIAPVRHEVRPTDVRDSMALVLSEVYGFGAQVGSIKGLGRAATESAVALRDNPRYQQVAAETAMHRMSIEAQMKGAPDDLLGSDDKRTIETKIDSADWVVQSGPHVGHGQEVSWAAGPGAESARRVYVAAEAVRKVAESVFRTDPQTAESDHRHAHIVDQIIDDAEAVEAAKASAAMVGREHVERVQAEIKQSRYLTAVERLLRVYEIAQPSQTVTVKEPRRFLPGYRTREVAGKGIVVESGEKLRGIIEDEAVEYFAGVIEKADANYQTFGPEAVHEAVRGDQQGDRVEAGFVQAMMSAESRRDPRMAVPNADVAGLASGR